MNDQQRKIFERWIIQNVNASIVPIDEGNDEALMYNLIHLLRGDNRLYEYQPDQDIEIQSWGILRYFLDEEKK